MASAARRSAIFTTFAALARCQGALSIDELSLGARHCLALSNQAVARQPSSVPRPPMRSGRPEEPRSSRLIALPDVRLQARFVVQRIVERIGSGVRPADIAVSIAAIATLASFRSSSCAVVIPHVVHSGSARQRAGACPRHAGVSPPVSQPAGPSRGRALRQVAGLDTGRARILANWTVSLPPVSQSLTSMIGCCVAGVTASAVCRLFCAARRTPRAFAARSRQRARASAAPLRMSSTGTIATTHDERSPMPTINWSISMASAAGRDAILCRRVGSSRLCHSPSDTLSAFLASATLGEELEPRSRSAEQNRRCYRVFIRPKAWWRIVFVIWLAEGFFPSASRPERCQPWLVVGTAPADPGSIAKSIACSTSPSPAPATSCTYAIPDQRPRRTPAPLARTRRA